MLYWKPLTEAAEDIVEQIPAGEETGEVTESAIENFQSITSLLHLPTWVGRLLFVIVIIIATSILLRLINRTFRVILERMREAGTSTTLLIFAYNVVRTLIYFFAAVIVIYSIPAAKSTMNMLLASGGVLAVILGFAGQEALSDVAGGVMILAFKPFEIGDFICYLDKNITGTIEDITLRHTIIVTPQNKRVIVPNGMMNQSVVENSNYTDSIVCDFYEIGITYESDVDRAIDLLREEVGRQPLYLDHRTAEEIKEGVPLVKVRVTQLADSAVVLRAWLWAQNVGDLAELKFTLNRSVKKQFDLEGVEFAYPHIHVIAQ